MLQQSLSDLRHWSADPPQFQTRHLSLFMRIAKREMSCFLKLPCQREMNSYSPFETLSLPLVRQGVSCLIFAARDLNSDQGYQIASPAAQTFFTTVRPRTRDEEFVHARHIFFPVETTNHVRLGRHSCSSLVWLPTPRKLRAFSTFTPGPMVKLSIPEVKTSFLLSDGTICFRLMPALTASSLAQ